MTWALKRQIFYVAILLVFVAIFAFLILSPVLTKAPSCTDNRRNGTETGIDCGGSCARACSAETDAVSILWARAFEVVPGRYNAVAYVVNHNKNAAIEKISYRFRFGDKNNVYIGQRLGSTFIPPGGNFAIFEPGIDIGNSTPVYTTFEFTEAPVWYQVPQDKIDQLKILVSNIELADADVHPRLSATIRNNSLFDLKNVAVVALLYEAGGNVVSASRTTVGELAPLATADVYFTWPQPFGAPIVEKEILPTVDVFGVKLE